MLPLAGSGVEPSLPARPSSLFTASLLCIASGSSSSAFAWHDNGSTNTWITYSIRQQCTELLHTGTSSEGISNRIVQ